jgi:CRP/FNR family cyclic AMP-dependent transcriptional regulator
MRGKYQKVTGAASGQIDAGEFRILKQGIVDQREVQVLIQSEVLRLELLDVILDDSVQWSSDLSDHSQCVALSSCLRGRLCQQVTNLPVRHLRAGERVYRMGNPARSVFLLRSGLVKTSALSPEGEELTLRIYQPGEILGELCLCGGGRRDEAVALEPSAVLEMPIATLMERLRRDPEAALELASTMCERLSDAYERAESLAWETVLERLIRALLKLAADFGEPTSTGTHIGHYIKQDELAKIVGARREVVSSLLNRLRNSGHISYSPRGFIAVNRAALQAYVDARASA